MDDQAVIVTPWPGRTEPFADQQGNNERHHHCPYSPGVCDSSRIACEPRPSTSSVLSSSKALTAASASRRCLPSVSSAWLSRRL